MISSRVEIEAGMLSLHCVQVAFVYGLLEQLAHELKLLRKPCRVLECQLVGTHFDAEYVNVLAELVYGVYGMLYFEEELAKFEVDETSHSLDLQNVRIVEANVQHVQIGLFVVPFKSLIKQKRKDSHLELINESYSKALKMSGFISWKKAILMANRTSKYFETSRTRC